MTKLFYMCTDTHNMQTCGNLGKRMMISSYILGIVFFFIIIIIMLEYICFCYYCKICYPTYFLVQDPSIFPFSFLFVILFFPLSVLHSLSSLCLTLHWQSSCSAHQVLGQAGTWLAAKKLALALWSEKFILLHLYCPTVRLMPAHSHLPSDTF